MEPYTKRLDEVVQSMLPPCLYYAVDTMTPTYQQRRDLEETGEQLNGYSIVINFRVINVAKDLSRSFQDVTDFYTQKGYKNSC